ncbi:2-amino-3-ketobutyrate coenzyme A ligase [Paramicrosporidium saccamoebae]|uniref:5-aminolevulinate synthase, mitochondrial n=1 Tax=Paramicrosporidium saccamoebae TaxID=1246581 RepID=A0A2H9TJY5_9FUNG|nr:2-amino-3-ketobutyrate coenzyme A ligase [Paramicrosporidium saccamoebae]
MSSVRFICGTQDLHKKLEAKISEFHGTDDTILYTSCFDANAGIFETLLGAEDAVISDALNHASIIDGIRLCKAQRLRYKHNDMDDLERLLKDNREKARTMLIATDGVFSMDGDLAKLPEICHLARKYDALVFVDDSHATGFIGSTGRGTAEHFNLEKEVDIISSTLGKALGGSSGRSEVISTLRQRSRPYLFSNSLPPVIASFALKALELVSSRPELCIAVNENAVHFRKSMTAKGFKIMGNASHPICPVLIGDAVIAGKMAAELRACGIFVIAFSYPVVPHDLARIRVQLSASHTKKQIDNAVAEFERIGKKYNVI